MLWWGQGVRVAVRGLQPRLSRVHVLRPWGLGVSQERWNRSWGHSYSHGRMSRHCAARVKDFYYSGTANFPESFKER